MNLFDFAIIIIVALAMLAGFSKGFFKSFASLLGWLTAIVVSILLAKTVAGMLSSFDFVSKYFFHNPEGFSFAEWIYGLLPESLHIEMDTVRNWIVVDGAVVEDASEILIDNVKERHAIIGIIVGIFEGSYVGTIADPEFLAYNVTNLAQAISILLANSILVLITGIAILIAFKIVAGIVVKIVKSAVTTEKEGKNILSRFLGMTLSGAKGLLICAVIMATLSYMINFPFLSTAKKELYDKKSVVSVDLTEYSRETTDRLLQIKDIDKLLKDCGFEKSVDLSIYPIPTDDTGPDETDPDDTDPDETDPDVTDPDETDPDVTDPDETDPDETNPD